jgi:5'-nucleotidase
MPAAASRHKLFGQKVVGTRSLSVKMRILISNDDGVYSPGIAALAKAAARFGDVRIVAPDVEQSSMSHAITSSRPLRFKRIHIGDFDAYSVNGTPADCVALGTHRWGHVDLVLSGINLGLNLGNALWHSGTLAAAKQAALLGARGIAFSTNVGDSHEPDFSALEPHVAKVLDLLMPNKTLCLVNVNVPEKPKGIRWTRQSVRHYDGKVVPDKDPMGRSIFWFTVTPLEGAAKGTDRWAIEHHWISITPLRLDLTDETDLARALALSDATPTNISMTRHQRRRSSSRSSSSSSKLSKGRKFRNRTK